MASSKEPASSTIEDLIQKAAGLQATIQTGSESPLYQKFMDRIAPLIDLPQTSEFVIDAFLARDVTAEKLSQALKGNVYFQQTFYRVIDSLSKRAEGEPPPALESAIVLLGMQNSRNLILAMQMARSILGAHPEWTKEGKLKTQPKDVLKHALEIESANATSKDEYTDFAFAAGLLFDMMTMIASSNWVGNEVGHSDGKKVVTFIETVWKQGRKTAQIAAAISGTTKQFSYRRYFYAASLVHDIGKIVMAMLDPTYLEFLEQCSKKDLPRAMRRYLEMKRFGVNHSLFGALICRYFKVFAPFSRAILYQHEPYLLSAREKKLFELSAFVSFSTNIASNFKKTDKLDDPIIARWKGPELGACKIDMPKVLQAVSKIS
jgi:HD-like signal output (HDOD) protein